MRYAKQKLYLELVEAEKTAFIGAAQAGARCAERVLGVKGVVMTTTLATVKSKKLDPSAEVTAAKVLVRLAKEPGLSLTGPDGLLKQFTKTVLGTALNEEIIELLGHEKLVPGAHPALPKG